MKKIILLLSLTPIFSYSQDMKVQLRQYFTEVRVGKYPAIPVSFSLPENAKDVLLGVKPYYSDTSANVRSKSYTIIRYVGIKSSQASVREQCVSGLVKACFDKDNGNVSTALNYLTQFSKQDFTKSSLNDISALLKSNPPHLDKVMRLVGYLTISDLHETIRPYTLAGNSQSVRWSAIVSLARMGDTQAIEEMMRRARKLKVNDDVVYEIFPDLIYSHQRVAIDYLVEVLMSDEKNCISSNPNNEVPILCGYRIMEQLVSVIKGFPLKTDQSGDIQTKDYEAALATVRIWFKDNNEYEIVKDGY